MLTRLGSVAHNIVKYMKIWSLSKFQKIYIKFKKYIKLKVVKKTQSQNWVVENDPWKILSMGSKIDKISIFQNFL